MYVNLFIPSEVSCHDQGITLSQATGFPDDPVVTITVAEGAAPMTLRVRVPAWTAGRPLVRMNGVPVADAVTPGWVVVSRCWLAGDALEVTLPMRVGLAPAPDRPDVQAVTYGPVVLAGLSNAETMPVLDTASVRRTASAPTTSG